MDRRLEALAGGEAGDAAVLGLRGTAAVAQAQVAYQHFHAHLRRRALGGAARRKGARVQRPLWASTSTKNPAYSDLLYVDNLIGPATVNTMPEGTLRAFEDHGTLHRTVDADPDGAAAALARLADGGIDMVDVEQTLEDEGVHSFAKSFDELLQSLTDKAAHVLSRSNDPPATEPPERGARMRIAMIGLGKMGANMTERLLKGGHEVVAYDLHARRVEAGGAEGRRDRRRSLEELAGKLTPPRAAWVMVPAGAATDDAVEELAGLFSKGDVIVDGGNSNYKEWIAPRRQAGQATASASSTPAPRAACGASPRATA